MGPHESVKGKRKREKAKGIVPSCLFPCPLTAKPLRPPFEEGAELPGARRMAQLAERLRLDLPDALACDREALADLFQRVLAAVADAKPHLDHLLFTRRERLQHRVGLFLQVQIDDGVGGGHDLAILDEIAKMRIFLFAD